MKRRHIFEEQLLAEIGANVGQSAKRIASRLFEFAKEERAERVGRHNSISVRFRLLGRREGQWLTLFVVTTAGTFYCGWLSEWQKKGFPKSIARENEDELKSALNRDDVVYGPAAFRNAISLKEIHQNWRAVSKAVRLTIRKLRLSERKLPARKFAFDSSASEVLATEGKMTCLDHLKGDPQKPSRKKTISQRSSRLIIQRHDE